MTGSAASQPQRTATIPRSLPGSGRVLVIEDEPLIRDTVRVLIALEGCDARTASDGPAALVSLERWQPDLILLDLTLPGMSGAAFIAAYHRTPPPHAPIILLTGRDLTTIQAIEMGAAGILPKPFDANDLLDVVAGFTPCSDDT
jgi:CheY-like chemotaxis protein